MPSTIAQTVALRHQRRTAAAPLVASLKQALLELKKYRAWVKGFNEVLKHAQSEAIGLPDGYVWQEEFRDFWAPFQPIERRLIGISDDIDLLTDLDLERYIDPPRGARIEDAIQSLKFYDHPQLGRSQIAYPIKNLQQWQGKFSSWVESAIQGVTRILSQTQRIS